MKQRVASVGGVLVFAALIMGMMEVAAKTMLPGVETNLLKDLLLRSLKGTDIDNIVVIVVAVFAGSAIAAKCWEEDKVSTYFLQYALICLFIAVGQIAMIGLGSLLHSVTMHIAGWFVGADKAVVDQAIQQTASQIDWDKEIGKIVVAWFSEPRWLLANLAATPVVALVTAKWDKIWNFGKDK